MMIVGVLSTVATVRGSVADGGMAAASAGVGTALLGPLAGALADRVGQRAVLLVGGAASVVAVAALLTSLQQNAALPPVLAAAAFVGGTTPQVAPFSRSRLVVLARNSQPSAEPAVMSYESAVDELSFVVGPVLVGVLMSLVAPWAPLVLGALLTATIVVAFALHTTGARVPTRTARGKRGRIPFSGLLVLASAMLLVGGVFGGILTALAEFMALRGAGEQTGMAYGAMSGGAILIALGIVLLPERVTLAMRWAGASTLAVAGALAMVTAPSIGWMLAALFVSGCGIGATLVALFSLGARIAPRGRATTVLTTLQSSLVVGQAIASAVGGLVAQSAGASAGFALVACLSVALAALGVAHLAVTRGSARPSD